MGEWFCGRFQCFWGSGVAEARALPCLPWCFRSLFVCDNGGGRSAAVGNWRKIFGLVAHPLQAAGGAGGAVISVLV